MQLSVRAGLTAVAVIAGCIMLATVVGMSRPDPTQADAMTADGPRTTTQAQRTPGLMLPTTGQTTLSASTRFPRPGQFSDHLLPNLRSLPPEEVEIRVAGSRRQLWFTSIIANAGYGPAEVTPDAVRPCPPGQQHASQVLYRDTASDARFDRATDLKTSTRRGGCMLEHPGHGHWHFDAVARYSLSRPGERLPVVGSNKVSFCLRDNRETPSVSAVKVPKHYGDCAPDKVQGISPGWADVYDTDLPDQHLQLPADLSNGSYCLRNEADPLGLLAETDETDNAAVLAVRIVGTDVSIGSARSCS